MKTDLKKIEIDFSNSHIWDQSAVMAIAQVINRFHTQGKSVYVTGLNEESQTTLDHLPVKLGPEILCRKMTKEHAKKVMNIIHPVKPILYII
ncbi:MAG: STAS domain-containing protein [Methanomicrobiales archaeon]|nr:STAS domain-containing protein [Methanomicrobiales archaeon]